MTSVVGFYILGPLLLFNGRERGSVIEKQLITLDICLSKHDLDQPLGPFWVKYQSKNVKYHCITYKETKREQTTMPANS